MLVDKFSLCNVLGSQEFNLHHFRYSNTNYLKESKKSGGENTDALNIYTQKLIFFSDIGYRKLVLSKSSLDSLVNYCVPKEIRIDVLRSLPNRKDIIQLDSQNCIKYSKTDHWLTFINCFRETSPKGSDQYSDSHLVHTHFFHIDLKTGYIVFDRNDTFSNDTFNNIQDVIEKYYSRFLVVVTFLELSEVNLEVVYGTLERNRKSNLKLTNKSRSNVILVTSKWNTVTINLNPIDVRGHWRLQPYGTGRSMYKYIWIEPFKKNLTVRQPQKMLV